MNLEYFQITENLFFSQLYGQTETFDLFARLVAISRHAGKNENETRREKSMPYDNPCGHTRDESYDRWKQKTKNRKKTRRIVPEKGDYQLAIRGEREIIARSRLVIPIVGHP